MMDELSAAALRIPPAPEPFLDEDLDDEEEGVQEVGEVPILYLHVPLPEDEEDEDDDETDLHGDMV